MTETPAADAIRRQFLAAPQTWAFTQRDYPDWHRGRRHYYVWVIPVDAPAIHTRLAAMRELFGATLVAPYQRQSHITLHVPGFIDGVAQQQALQRQVSALQAAGISAFELKVHGVNSFLASPFLDVVDNSGGISALRQCLLAEAAEDRDEAFHAHLTIGLYGKTMPTQSLAELMRAYSELPAIHVPVRRIDLCCYRSDDIGSALEVQASVELGVADTGT